VILPGGNFIVVEDVEGVTVALVNLWDGAILKTYPSPMVDEFGGLLAAISPDGKLFAMGATNGPIEVWQEGKEKPQYSLKSPFEWTSIDFSPDGKSLVTASDAVQVWNLSDGRLRFSPTGALTSPANGLFSPDGAILVTADQGMLHLWNMSDGALLQSLRALPPAVFSPDGALLVACAEGAIQFWKVSDGALLRSQEAATLPEAFTSDGRTLIAMRDGVVETWGLPTP
jgi:WD40 repeat protein